MVDQLSKETTAATSAAAPGSTEAAEHSRDSRGEKEPLAYAKLWGKLNEQTFHAFILSLPTTLGRGSSTVEGKLKGFVDLGKSKALSREHAVISWSASEGQYKIKCLGKNGMVVAGKFRAKGGEESLQSRTPIKLGPAHLYFLLPEGDFERNVTQKSSKTSTSGDNGPVAGTLTSRTGTVTPQPETGAVPTDEATTAASRPTSQSAKKRSFDEMVLAAFRSSELSASAAAGGLYRRQVETWVAQNYSGWNSEGEKLELTAGIDGVLKEKYVSRDADRWVEASTRPTAKRSKVDISKSKEVMTTTTKSSSAVALGSAHEATNGQLPAGISQESSIEAVTEDSGGTPNRKYSRATAGEGAP